jgi:hypothetical protein
MVKGKNFLKKNSRFLFGYPSRGIVEEPGLLGKNGGKRQKNGFLC